MAQFTLVLIRHAPTKKNILPAPDSDIADVDAAQLKRLATALPQGVDWWVSPLKRASQTAEALVEAGAKPLSITTKDHLKEQDYGDWHGRLIDEIWEQIKDEPEITPPNGERFSDLGKRSKALIADMQKLDGDTLILIGHAMIIRSIIATLLGLTPEQALGLGLDHLSLTRLISFDGQWALDCLNQTY